MRIARLPLFMLPVIVLVIMAIVALGMAMVDHVHLRGAYQGGPT